MTLHGRRAKSYEVWGKLSSGGMGEVWLAKHVDLALPVVLKTLLPTQDEPFDVRYGRMLDEARIMARLASPRVVRVMDVGSADDDDDTRTDPVPFLVEEYVDGLDLGELDARRRAALRRGLPLPVIAELLADAAAGLHAAHQAGIVHRDVKPGNFFTTGHGDVKVGDFGVSVVRVAKEQARPAGTLTFMAPEQLTGEKLDRRADVYSLGATAFVLRYGIAPFESLSDAVSPSASPRFPPARTPDEAYFQHVVGRMLSRRPDARFPTLREAQFHLRHVASARGHRVESTRVSPSVYLVGTTKVAFEVGDIASIECDAVVNSAYSDMTMQGGVGSALLKKGGAEIEAEAVAGGARALGECVATKAGALPCREVLHAVSAWSEVSCAARATQRALLLAEERGHTRIALPAIGTGLGRVTLESCADAMVSALRWHLMLGGSHLGEVRFVLYDDASLARFSEVAAGVLAGQADAGAEDLPTAGMLADPSTSDPTVFAMHAVTPRLPKA